MKFIYFASLLLVFGEVSGRATDSSESESTSSSQSSSSEEMTYNEKADLIKVGSENSTIVEVRDDETLKKDEELAKFDEAIEAEGKNYIEKRADFRTNSSESLTDDDMAVMEHFEKSDPAISAEDEGSDRKNETVLGIDTFGAQGI